MMRAAPATAPGSPGPTDGGGAPGDLPLPRFRSLRTRRLPAGLLKRGPSRGAGFGNVAIVAFLLTQAFDGAFTYVGVLTFGLAIEVNPIMASLMESVGHGPALASAKLVAAGLGILLHLHQVHGAIAALTGVYFAVAIIPWAAVLFVL